MGYCLDAQGLVTVLSVVQFGLHSNTFKILCISSLSARLKRIGFVVHLGTNDITRYKADANQDILEITTAMNKIHGKFPSSEIAF